MVILWPLSLFLFMYFLNDSKSETTTIHLHSKLKVCYLLDGWISPSLIFKEAGSQGNEGVDMKYKCHHTSFDYRTRAIKGRGFYSKNIFWTCALWLVWPKFVHVHIIKIDIFHLNAPILGHFKGCGYNSRATFNGASTVLMILILEAAVLDWL